MKDLYISTMKKYVEFKGRSSKKEFWTFFLINLVISIIIGIIGAITGLTILGSIFNLAILCPTLGVWVRRMNDINKEWFFMLIPIYGLYLAFQESHVGANDHGEQPVD